MLIITKVTWRCTHAHFKNNHMKLELEMEIDLFAVATPPKTRSTLSPYYLGHKELMRAIEGQIGVRFKKCKSIEEAVEFSRVIIQEEPVRRHSIERSLSPLPGIKNPIILFNIIKKGDVDGFLKTVWGNPRFLISRGDTPEIIHPGTRRNALHLAVQYHQLEICWHLMHIIRSERFWREVYPLSDVHKSKIHLIDLYLNIQDGNDRAKIQGLEVGEREREREMSVLKPFQTLQISLYLKPHQ